MTRCGILYTSLQVIWLASITFACGPPVTCTSDADFKGELGLLTTVGPSGLKVSDTPPQNTIPDYVVFTLQLTGSGLADTDRIRIPKPGNPRHFAIIEGGRVYLTLFVQRPCFMDISSAKPLFQTLFGIQMVSETMFPAFKKAGYGTRRP